MSQLYLIIPGEPIAQPRARAARIGDGARMYTPTKNGIADYKAAIRLLASQEYHGPLLECPVQVDCEFVFSRPSRLVWKRRPMFAEPHTTKPDRDNCDKAVLDALQGVILTDDKIVYKGHISKRYAAGDEQPHTAITIAWGDTVIAPRWSVRRLPRTGSSGGSGMNCRR